MFIDFLTEHPTATSGTVGVDGVLAGVFPGVERSLATRRTVTLEGKDAFGAPQKADVPVSGIGPLLVLKLNAFAGRQQAKDAYDVLLGVSRFVEGPEAAIAAFRMEASAGNRGYARAVETLRSNFFKPDQSGPLRCAAFALDGQSGIDSYQFHHRRIVEQLVTIGRALAGEG